MLKTGDIVRWIPGKGTLYAPGPYRVMFADRGRVRLQHMDGRQVTFTSRSGHRFDHNFVESSDLELDPFLDSAQKYIQDAEKP